MHIHTIMDTKSKLLRIMRSSLVIGTLVFANSQLFCLRSANRTHACTRPTVQACICINYILSVFLRNTFYRAFSRTCTTSDTLIINYICHFTSPPTFFCSISAADRFHCSTIFQKVKSFKKNGKKQVTVQNFDA